MGDLWFPDWFPSHTTSFQRSVNFLNLSLEYLASNHLFDAVFILIFSLSLILCCVLVCVEVFGIPLLWLTEAGNGSDSVYQGGDGLQQRGSSSSSDEGHSGRPDEGGDLPPGSGHRQRLFSFFRKQNDFMSSANADRPIRRRCVLTQSALTKLPGQFTSSSESSLEL
ncbi:hypothetical protein BIW11_13911 [Tropilaelaps mercedesae]|uniref:Uncharacterized protein n=1 Tax=Tropilaelaps mercedesae TaxID=418985 RepID=A0A1V9X050_9ACAR|nr:hypothetical protein BIW11_13911 [Tropilaelaps mercedesae]